jgi:hypothetical protein
MLVAVVVAEEQMALPQPAAQVDQVVAVRVTTVALEWLELQTVAAVAVAVHIRELDIQAALGVLAL